MNKQEVTAALKTMVAADYITVDAVIEEDVSVHFFTKRRAESGTNSFATLRKGPTFFKFYHWVTSRQVK